MSDYVCRGGYELNVMGGAAPARRNPPWGLQESEYASAVYFGPRGPTLQDPGTVAPPPPEGGIGAYRAFGGVRNEDPAVDSTGASRAGSTPESDCSYARWARATRRRWSTLASYPIVDRSRIRSTSKRLLRSATLAS